ncbi:MAG: Co2+/Mg2+ efflux protein ApaG [Acidobacteriota bacterium]|nr:Co2+/Mg2+ efflux protein ApaG [Acidobacteriota bacterium]
MNESSATTEEIRVHVRSEYSAEHSRPGASRWFFLYHITIENQGVQTVQLLSRHWIITDGDGSTEEVQGPGVVGEQPVLAPGESFEYTSGCPLSIPFGTMHGSYEMREEGGREFRVEIAPFALSEPHAIN